MVLWAYDTGGTCDVSTLDTLLSYGGFDILEFFDTGFSDNIDNVASELEYEINWYIEYNCSAW